MQTLIVCYLFYSGDYNIIINVHYLFSLCVFPPGFLLVLCFYAPSLFSLFKSILSIVCDDISAGFIRSKCSILTDVSYLSLLKATIKCFFLILFLSAKQFLFSFSFFVSVISLSALFVLSLHTLMHIVAPSCLNQVTSALPSDTFVLHRTDYGELFPMYETNNVPQMDVFHPPLKDLIR
ncbi:unnamed protein product [Gadus morhua 'NCC']